METVTDGQTGVLYGEQGWRHLAASMDRLERLGLGQDVDRLVSGVDGFGTAAFERRFLEVLRSAGLAKGRTLRC